jgi:DNA-binding response OmpR family regulator
MRILLVDDDPGFATMVKELLTRAGHEVEIAWDGSEALVAAGQDQPGIVIMDYKMPGFTGAVTARMLRSFAPGVRIIGVSGLASVDTEWCDRFVAKEDVLTELAGIVDELASQGGRPA